MPTCFTLIRKGEDKPIELIQVDEEICKAVGDEVHPMRWCRGWYDSIGFSLACGHGFNRIRETFRECEDLSPIIDFLEANYTAEHWYQR